tara:strand:+ start:274 stop:759 length:486 start_codon:yes stop_codon:yes gene_type:complete
MIQSSGVLFLTSDTNRYLFLLRNGNRHQNTWGLVGGKVEKDESPWEAVQREIHEEIGYHALIDLHDPESPGFLDLDITDYNGPILEKIIPVEMFTSEDKKFEYHTYVYVIQKEFIPQLNHEHKGYAWTELDSWPKPLHPGLFNTLNLSIIQNKLKTIEQTI